MNNRLAYSIMAVLLICSCQVVEVDEAVYINNLEVKGFTGTIEDNATEGTRTSLDNKGNVLWKKSDQVSIFVGSTINEHFQVSDESDGKTSASFNKVSYPGFSAGNEIDNNVAFYPYASKASISKSENSYIIKDISLPATQIYAEASFGNGAFPMAAVTSSTEDTDLKFKNILGGVKLQLKGASKISSISIAGNNKEILCGSAEVTVSNGSVPSINLTDAMAKIVTLDCGPGVQLDTEIATSFVIALPPMILSGGFTVVVRDTENKQMKISTTKSQTINRSCLLKMPTIEYRGESIVPNPLTFKSSGETFVSLTKIGTPEDISLEYSINAGAWTNYTVGDVIALTDGESVSFRAGIMGNTSFWESYKDYFMFTMTGSGTIIASGTIMSLIDLSDSMIIPSASCFRLLFSGCTILTVAPELPATTLTDFCYYQMFSDCTGLTTAPELPALTLANDCYECMFAGCTELTAAPKLPAVTLADRCYAGMFDGCTGLTAAPELPALTLAVRCYEGMFFGCVGLTSAPNLPATKLSDLCYSCMFSNCSRLTTAPDLPATVLADYCYLAMFNRCTGLTAAPELPATTLSSGCYREMFNGCSELTVPPELPALTLAVQCYGAMFLNCAGLTTAPELPATTLAGYCYQSMFHGCTNLKYIKMLATDVSAAWCLDNWVDGVASTGTFVKNSNATWSITGPSGIPAGWDVITE